MALGYGLAEAVGERVQHAVVRVHRGQPVLVQLVGHDAHQLFHALVVVCPVTDDLGGGDRIRNTPHTVDRPSRAQEAGGDEYLETVGQVAVGVGEVWLEFQSCAVGSNGFWNVARILKKKRLPCE